MSVNAFEDVTESQRECLRLILTMHSSKEIAALLGISASAVDKRVERAVQTLGAPTRFVAARMLAAHEEGTTYERVASDRIDIPEDASPVPSRRQDGALDAVRRMFGLEPRHPSGERRNNLTGTGRLAVILILVLVLSVSAMALLNIGQTLTRLVGH